jgi:chromosome segregation ATPase
MSDQTRVDVVELRACAAILNAEAHADASAVVRAAADHIEVQGRELASFKMRYESSQEALTETLTELSYANGYASRLFLALAPQCDAQPDLLGVLTQLDNWCAGARADLAAAQSHARDYDALVDTLAAERKLRVEAEAALAAAREELRITEGMLVSVQKHRDELRQHARGVQDTWEARILGAFESVAIDVRELEALEAQHRERVVELERTLAELTSKLSDVLAGASRLDERVRALEAAVDSMEALAFDALDDDTSPYEVGKRAKAIRTLLADATPTAPVAAEVARMDWANALLSLRATRSEAFSRGKRAAMSVDTDAGEESK